MNPLFHIDLSISDSLKIVRKSVLIYETIIGKNGARVQTYLSSAIDDHSRLLLASRFYDSQEEAIVEDTFRQAILRYGKFDACYFDNGSQSNILFS